MFSPEAPSPSLVETASSTGHPTRSRLFAASVTGVSDSPAARRASVVPVPGATTSPRASSSGPRGPPYFRVSSPLCPVRGSRPSSPPPDPFSVAASPHSSVPAAGVVVDLVVSLYPVGLDGSRQGHGDGDGASAQQRIAQLGNRSLQGSLSPFLVRAAIFVRLGKTEGDKAENDRQRDKEGEDHPRAVLQERE